jgi:hypothetical protein
MEYIGGCILFGIGFYVLVRIAASIFHDEKQRRKDRDSDMSKW